MRGCCGFPVLVVLSFVGLAVAEAGAQIDRISIALDIDQDAVLPVPHRATKPMAVREPVDERTKADPLNDPFDQDAAARSISRLPAYG